MDTGPSSRRYIFTTTDMQLRLRSLAYEHESFIVVITYKQKSRISAYTQLLSQNRCEQIWQLLENKLIRVVEEPRMDVVRSEQRRFREIARIQNLAEILSTEPYVLVATRTDRELFARANIGCETVETFRSKAKKAKEIHRAILKGEVTEALKVGGFVAVLFLLAFFGYWVVAKSTNPQEVSLIVGGRFKTGQLGSNQNQPLFTV
jgi:hypothetical protein